MAIASLDTNILVHAADPTSGERHDRARDIVRRVSLANGVLTQQVIGEFLNLGHKSTKVDRQGVRDMASGLCRVLPILPTKRETLLEAHDLAARYRLQFWDAVIIAVCRTNDVAVLFTEDMQDGQTIADVLILDPLKLENADRVDQVLSA